MRILRRIATVAAILALPSVCCASPETHGRVRPLHQVYRTHQGWEYRTEHFITVATTSGEDARWAGDELEAAWVETARLADHFGTAHRSADFGVVGALVTAAGVAPRPTGTRYPSFELPRDASIVQTQLAAGNEASRAAATQTLRRGAAATMLRQSGYAKTLPRWAAHGLMDFVAEAPWDKARFAEERRAIQQGETPRRQRSAEFRYLMAADDGVRGATTLAALAEWTVPQQRPLRETNGNPGDYSADRLERRVPKPWRWDKVAARRATEAGTEQDLPELPNVSAAQLEQRTRQWLADPEGGATPVSISLPTTDPAARRAQEMALLVKLWQHFRDTGSRGQAGAASDVRPMDLDSLYRQLTAPGGPSWSVTDVDGRLLTWRDRQRIDELFAGVRSEYRTTVRDGGAVLEYREPEGKTLQAWLDRSGSEPNRAVVRVQRVRMPNSF